MNKFGQHPDSAGQPSFGEFGRTLQSKLLALQRMVAAIRELCAQELTSTTPSPCRACPTSEICEKQSERLDALLNGSYEGALHSETTMGVNVGDIATQQDRLEHVDGHEQLKTDPGPVLLTDLYLVNENGHRRVVTAPAAEHIRQEWSGHFLLDLPRQALCIRTGKTVKRIALGSRRLHWGVEKVFMVGMSQPGTSFGYATFGKVSPGGTGIGHVGALTRYVFDARQAIGDTGRRTRYIHKTRVEPSESPTRWGYIFDDRYRYLVIAKCLPAECGQTAKSIEQSRVDLESGQ